MLIAAAEIAGIAWPLAVVAVITIGIGAAVQATIGLGMAVLAAPYWRSLTLICRSPPS